jgi:hypothetical protein
MRWGSLATAWNWDGQSFPPVCPQLLPEVRVSVHETMANPLSYLSFLVYMMCIFLRRYECAFFSGIFSTVANISGFFF